MNGDISLSATLGGLRIANPDDEAILSPMSTESSHEDAIAHDEHDSAALGTISTNQTTTTGSLSTVLTDQPRSESPKQDLAMAPSLMQSIPQHNATYPPSEYELFRRGTPPADPRLRPLSALYYHQNSSGSSSFHRDPGQFAGDVIVQQPGVSRSGSKNIPQQFDRGVPKRKPSERDRYRQSQQYGGPQFNAAEGSIPTRRASGHIPNHATPRNAHPAEALHSENGPPRSSEEWKERGAAVATKQEIDADGKAVSKVVKKGVNDFIFGRTLGEGSYSTVLAATDRHTGREYAIKVLDKKHIIKEKKVKYVNIERDTLNRLTEHPGIVRLYYTFQDERSLYFVLDLATGGELLGVLKKTGSFDLECTRFYAAQLLDSIAYMHSKGVIHRDLKPENVLLDSHMHTKITDFGTAKILSLKPDIDGTSTSGDPMDGAETDRATSFVGTAEYVSPELLTDKNACKASDLWAFGCIVFQLLAGRPPFKAANEYLTFQKIVALEYQFPDGFPSLAKDLIQRLLVLDPSKRLPIEHIKAHPFFDHVKWGRDLWRTIPPKLKPYVPPAAEPIKLNGASSYPGAVVQKAPTASPALASTSHPRPHLRSVTELPPPSQLDIDWSPVLTRHNERILKMGNLIVTSLPLPQSPQPSGSDAPKKFSRFFGGGTTKKRQRLVMITSTARLIVVPAGGEEKKAKLELSLSTPGVNCRTYQDSKGLTAFCVETRDRQYTFEDPRASTSDPQGSKYSTDEWIEKINWAKELAFSQTTASSSYSADAPFSDINNSMPSPVSTAGSDPNLDQPQSSHRNVLRRDTDSDSLKKKHRFSKRQSKSGLAAVF